MTSRLLAPLAVVAVLLTAAPTAAADRFQHDLGLVDGHLRIAIEYAPAELGEALGSAELVCGLGERALAAGEADLAAADWATLGQLVDRVAARESRRVDVAFANADSLLGDLRERYERRWAGDAVHLRELRRGVASARAGIATVRAAVAGLTTPFDRWRAHECAAATLGVATTLGRVPAGLGRINKGMLRLWRLARLPPPRTGGGSTVGLDRLARLLHDLR
jgi:hypothetical protein